MQLRAASEGDLATMAAFLVDAFPHSYDRDEALREAEESLAADRISLVAIEGGVVGWAGAQPQYAGHVWELHPLVVAPAHRRRGIGRALVARIEEEARQRGGTTMWLGSDDESSQTSIAGIDLYPDPIAHLQRITDRGGHPFVFYRKLGYVVVGVLPDANGPGKPDLFLARRL
jgi:aminoglycoside 6'-N-acetyltransferase I